jgi:hypothetical protein
MQKKKVVKTIKALDPDGNIKTLEVKTPTPKALHP